MVIASALAAGSALAGVPTTTTTVTTLTTTTVTSSTTSTTLQPACTDEVSFDSANCRLDELAADVVAADLGGIGTKLGNALNKADSNVNLGNEQCDAGDAKTAKKRLKKAIRRMIQYGHRLRSLKARKTIPEEVRTPLVDQGAAIQQDLEALRDSVICPPASPSGAFVS